MAYVKSLHGSSGSFAVPTDYADCLADTIIHFYEWHATIARELLDDTRFENADNFKRVIGGMYDLKGTAVGTLIKSAALPGLDATHGMGVQNVSGETTGSFTLTVASGDTYVFDGIISNINTVVNKPRKIIVTVSFESHGDVAVNG
jgi:hypothetical protein